MLVDEVFVINGAGEGAILDSLKRFPFGKGGAGRGEILNDRGGVTDLAFLKGSLKRKAKTEVIKCL